MYAQELLFDTPIWLMLTLTITALGLIATAISRQDKRLKWAGIVLLVITITLGITSRLVETDAKKVDRATRALLNAVLARDGPSMKEVMDARCALGPLNREQIIDLAKRSAEDLELMGVHLDSLDFTKQGPLVIVCTMQVTSHQKGGLGGMTETMPTTWEMRWVKAGDGWKLQVVKPLKLFNQNGAMIDQYIASHYLSRSILPPAI